MKIGIFLDNTINNWGPGKLALNTIKGFDKNEINYKINDFYEYNLCISGSQFQWKFLGNYVKNTIIGPCSIGEPLQYINTINTYPKTLVASEWVKNLWSSSGVPIEKIGTWFGGIDTDIFQPKKNIKYDCLILFKNRSFEELHLIQNVLNKKKLSSLILNHGSYDEEFFLNAANNCKFSIILHNTETQGFAIMEVMSMDLPILVFDFNTWDNKYFESTSVPYFHEKCGNIVPQKDFNSEVIEKKIDSFLDNINSYSPREIILKNYTLDHSVNLLKKIFIETWN